MSEKLALKDAPRVCALLGVLIGLIAITILHGWRLDVIDRDELRPISGLLQRVHTTNLPKAGPKLHLYLIDSRQRRHHLEAECIGCSTQGLSVN